MKKWYKSKTVILNLAVAVLTVLESSTGVLQPLLPTHWFAFVAIALPVANVALRFITTQPIGK